jgi:hypothetical protein
VASRQEEKERRRQERMEREAAEARAASRRKRLQLVGGGLLAVAAVAAVIVALVVGLGGGDEEGEPRQASSAAAAALPEQKVSDLKEAADAAGCTLTNASFEGQNHADRNFTAADYKTNPPTSGDHNPTWYEDGIYEPGTTPRLGELVHTLEHGRIDVQYKAGSPKSLRDQLEAFVGENDGYHMLMFENTTNMDAAVAATAWTHSLTCAQMKPEVFDALRTFRDEYLDKGPEKVP